MKEVSIIKLGTSLISKDNYEFIEDVVEKLSNYKNYIIVHGGRTYLGELVDLFEKEKDIRYKSLIWSAMSDLNSLITYYFNANNVPVKTIHLQDFENSGYVSAVAKALEGGFIPIIYSSVKENKFIDGDQIVKEIADKIKLEYNVNKVVFLTNLDENLESEIELFELHSKINGIKGRMKQKLATVAHLLKNGVREVYLVEDEESLAKALDGNGGIRIYKS